MKPRFIYRAWKARLRDQRLEIRIAQALIEPGDFVVDAGANKGAYLFWLRKFAGRQGAVLAFEPQPALAEYLRRACDSLGWNNVQVSSTALSNRAGKSTLHVPGGGVSPGASLESSVLDQTEGNRLECTVDTLDQQLEGRPPLRFLKVDVEGHELSLFEGGRQTLERDQPPLLFECEARHLSKHGMREVFQYLIDLGYSGLLLRRDRLLPIDQFDPAVHQPRNSGEFWNEPGYSNNFVFVRKNQLSKINLWMTTSR